MPTAFDYVARISNWQKCMTDPELVSSEPCHTPGGDLWQDSGGFATVFRFRLPAGEYKAVRCFTRELPGIQERYERIDEHLRQHPTASMVGFEFVSEGILTAEGWKPIVKMSWADGVRLDSFMGDAVRRSDGAALASLEESWSELLSELLDNEIAHGDLHPSNILVGDDGCPVLIDYDGLYVPALSGQPSTVLGLPNFIHPKRSEDDYGPDMDRFGGWLIRITIRAFRCDLSLWSRYYEDDRKLLFSEEDLRQPDTTAVWHDLRRIRDTELQEWLDTFADACRKPPSKTPELPLHSNRRLRNTFLRALSNGDDMLMLLAWDQGAGEIEELQPYYTRIAKARGVRVQRPAPDPWHLFVRACSARDVSSMLSLWSSVKDLPQAGLYEGAVRRLADQLKQRSQQKHTAPLDALRRALSAGDAVKALMIWESVKDLPEARQFGTRIARLKRQASLPG